MAYVTHVADWYDSLTGGWSSLTGSGFPGGYYPGTERYWSHSLNGGFWRAGLQYDNFGDVAGVGNVSGDWMVSYLFKTFGDVAGVGAISSIVVAPEKILIYGAIKGVGAIVGKWNYNRQRAIYPELRVNDTYEFNECPIAALEFVGFSPDKVINIIQRQDEIYENTEGFFTIETLVKENESDAFFPLTHYTYDETVSGKINYLVTNVTTEKQDSTPLFYQYELLYDARIDEDATPITLYKNNESIVSKDKYSLQYSYDLISDSGRYSQTNWTPIDRTENVHRVRLLLPYETNDPNDFYMVTYKKSVYGGVTDQRELVSLEPLYSGQDFTIDSRGVVLTSTSAIDNTSQSLYIVKDPKERIEPIGVEPPSYQPDGIHYWRMRFSPGSLFVPPGFFSGTSKVAYKLVNHYNPGPTAITNVKPAFISDDIIKVGQGPLFVNLSNFTFPTYDLQTYDRTSYLLVEPSGQIGVSINGGHPSGLAIKSIDTEKGYIQFNRVLDPTSEIEMDYFVDNSGHLVVNNLELNPKATSAVHYHISGYLDGLGLALRPYDSGNFDTELLYIYDPTEDESTRVCQPITPIGGIPTGVAWATEDFFTLCEVNLNRLTKDIVKITDARQITKVHRGALQEAADTTSVGGIDDHETEWYTDKGYYGGEPLAFGGTVVIHIPSGTFFGARDRWIESMEEVVSDEAEAIDRGIKEFNFYTDQVIKRYISGGTNYVIIPIDSSGNFMDIVDMEF